MEMEGAPRGPPDPPSVVPGEAEAGLVASGAREEESGRDGMPGVWVPNTSRLPGGLGGWRWKRGWRGSVVKEPGPASVRSRHGPGQCSRPAATRKNSSRGEGCGWGHLGGQQAWAIPRWARLDSHVDGDRALEKPKHSSRTLSSALPWPSRRLLFLLPPLPPPKTEEVGLVAPRPALCEPGTLWLVLGAGLEALTRVISVPESEELRSRGAGDGQRMQAAGPASGQETHLALSLQLDAQTEEQCKACCQRLWASVPALPGFCLPTDLFPLRCFHLRKQVFHLLP